MNLVQLSNELEYLPKDKLAEMAQDPSSMYPPYLVLAEIQRRTQMEKMYAAAQPRPQTTVAEEVVNEFAMTNPNAGISSMTGSAPTDRFSPESKDIPAPVLMQTAANGGLTAYANKGKTETTGSKIKEFLTAPLRGIEELGRLRYNAGKNISNQLRENASYRADIKTDLRTRSLPVIKGEKTLEEFKNEMRELYNDDFIKDDKGYRNSIKNYYYNFEQKFLPRFQKEIAETGEMPKDVIKYYDDYENFRNNKQYLDRFYIPYERPDLTLSPKAGGGITGYQNRGQTMIEQSLANPQERGFFGRTFDYIKENPGSAALNAASLGLILVPGVGLVSAVGRGLQGINYLRRAKQAADLAKKGAQATITKPGLVSKTATRANTNQPLGGAAKALGLSDDVTQTVNVAGRVYSPLRGSTAALGGIGGLQAINYAMQDDKVTNEMPPLDRELTAEEKELLRLQNEAAMAETKPEKKGLDDRALDLVGLGGLIMGARNVSELGKGISDFATAKQVARGDKAQQDYYAASAEKTRAEIEGLPLENKMEALEQVNDILTKATEGEIKLTEKELIYYNTAAKTLTDQILSLQGIDLNTQASMDKNLIASFG